MTERSLNRQTFEVTAISDETDRTFWHDRSIEERMEHQQRLCRLNYGDQIPQRLVRVLEVVDRSPQHQNSAVDDKRSLPG